MDKRIEGILRPMTPYSKIVDRMTEVKGVGKTTALTILAYLPDLDSLSCGQMVSLWTCPSTGNPARRDPENLFMAAGQRSENACIWQPNVQLDTMM